MFVGTEYLQSYTFIELMPTFIELMPTFTELMPTFTELMPTFIHPLVLKTFTLMSCSKF